MKLLENNIMRRFSNSSVGVEHDSNLASHCSWGKISKELCSDHSIVSVSFSDGSPDGSEPGVVLDGFCLKDVSYSLSEVEVGIFLVINSFDFDQGKLLTLGWLSSFESSEDSLGIESMFVLTLKSINT